MVFNARERDHVGHVYDLTRCLFDVLRSAFKQQNKKQEKRDNELNDLKQE